ncbi:MAG TPA: hypothetical protein VHD36_00065 [Pirellulales bacterium]|nr:hypothetical protein [Pirellulales bacterium]
MWPQIIETLSSDPGILLGAILGTLGILAATSVCITAIVSEAWRKVRQTEDNNALKQSMLDRGMSAEEITAVVRAAPEKRASFSFNAGRGGVRCRT